MILLVLVCFPSTHIIQRMGILGVSGEDTKLAPELLQDAPSFQPGSHGISSLLYRAGSDVSPLAQFVCCKSYLPFPPSKPCPDALKGLGSCEGSMGISECICSLSTP